MSWRTRIALGAVWVASLVAVGAWAQTSGPSEPKVMSGSDLGFRVERLDRGTPIRRLVVRVNGQWVDAGFAVGAVRATQ